MPKVIVGFAGQCRITIPKELASAKGWNKKGVALRFIESEEGKVYIKKAK